MERPPSDTAALTLSEAERREPATPLPPCATEDCTDSAVLARETEALSTMASAVSECARSVSHQPPPPLPPLPPLWFGVVMVLPDEAGEKIGFLSAFCADG